MMKWDVQPTFIYGLRVITPKLWLDNRGAFCELYHARDFRDLGLPDKFVQENQSISRRGVLRGLHFQVEHPQGKLVRVAVGKAWDIAADLRPESPTFGKSFCVELSAENGRMLFIPERFAHGFLSLEENTHLVYLCTDYYHPQSDSGIRWNDPDLDVDWSLARFSIEEPFLSAKDACLPTFQEFLSRGVFQ